MRRKPKIGQYRHTPASELRPGPDGTLRHTRTRRRFPYRGLVVLAYGLFGPLVCAAVPALMRAIGQADLLPRHLSDRAVPPAPSLNNVLFGAGAAETALACAVVGALLWRQLWGTRLSPALEERGLFGTLPPLLAQGLLLGPLMAFLAVPIAAFGLFLRAPEVNQPLFVRPFFALFAAAAGTLSAVSTGIIPLVVIVLGLLLGTVTAVGVAYFRQFFPEEPVLRD
jgi:hypothetical protein